MSAGVLRLALLLAIGCLSMAQSQPDWNQTIPICIDRIDDSIFSLPILHFRTMYPISDPWTSDLFNVPRISDAENCVYYKNNTV